MNNMIGFLLINGYAFLLIVATAILFFSKQRLKQVEVETYKYFLLTNIFLSLSGLILGIFVNPDVVVSDYIIMVFNKVYLCSLILWICLLTFYYLDINLKDKKFEKKLKKIFKIIGGISLLLVILLPIKVYINDNGVIASGPSVMFTYTMFGLGFFVQILCVIKNYRNFRSKKWIPLYLLIFLGVMSLVCMIFDPSLNYIINPAFIFITIIMYHTIENPDVQIMEELYKNKKLIEKSNEDTSNFLFRMTQDIKKPIKNMIDVSDNLKFSDNINELKEGMKFINNNSRDLDYLINDALDVSAMNTRRLKIYDSRYNPVNLFKEVEYRFRESIDKNVKFHFSISNNMPEYLYGDSIKLKQSISSILKKALDKTEKGSIELDVSDIIKYGICRLIITITDTGCGISIDEVNKILSLNSEDLAAIDLRDRDGEYLNLREVKKMISLLGGNLMVKSETGKGTVVTIVLEQKIVETRQTTISKKLEAYEQSLYHNKKIMVVDDDAKELAMITTWLENHDAVVNGSLFGRDCIEKIASNMKYDLILLDDDTSTYSALEVLKELKEKTNFKIPVVVMIDDGKEFIKLHYLQDGFADCILKSKLESELERILKRF